MKNLNAMMVAPVVALWLSGLTAAVADPVKVIQGAPQLPRTSGRAKCKCEKLEENARAKLAKIEKETGASSPETAGALVTLARVYYLQHRHADAETALQRAIKIQRASLPADSPILAGSLMVLTDVYLESKPKEVEKLVGEAIPITEKAVAANPADLPMFDQLEHLYVLSGDLKQAKELSKRALKLARSKNEPPLLLAQRLESYSLLLRDTPDLPQAETALNEAISIRSARGDIGAKLLWDRITLSCVLLGQKKYDKASAMLLQDAAKLKAKRQCSPTLVRTIDMVAARIEKNKPANGAALVKKLQSASKELNVFCKS